jgi:hypothetical protein
MAREIVAGLFDVRAGLDAFVKINYFAVQEQRRTARTRAVRRKRLLLVK